MTFIIRNHVLRRTRQEETRAMADEVARAWSMGLRAGKVTVSLRGVEITRVVDGVFTYVLHTSKVPT